MGYSDIIAREAETLSPEKQAEILDFIAFLSRTSRNHKGGHCEERSDVAIQQISSKAF